MKISIGFRIVNLIVMVLGALLMMGVLTAYYINQSEQFDKAITFKDYLPNLVTAIIILIQPD